MLLFGLFDQIEPDLPDLLHLIYELYIFVISPIAVHQ
jgi:hypothetical protein